MFLQFSLLFVFILPFTAVADASSSLLYDGDQAVGGGLAVLTQLQTTIAASMTVRNLATPKWCNRKDCYCYRNSVPDCCNKAPLCLKEKPKCEIKSGPNYCMKDHKTCSSWEDDGWVPHCCTLKGGKGCPDSLPKCPDKN